MRSPSSRDRTEGASWPLPYSRVSSCIVGTRRAAHLLELCGEPLDEEADASLLGPDFLMHIMDVREELDAGPGSARLQELQQQNAAEAADVCVQLGAAFVGNQLTEAQALTARLQYLHRVEATIRAAL